MKIAPFFPVSTHDEKPSHEGLYIMFALLYYAPIKKQ